MTIKTNHQFSIWRKGSEAAFKCQATAENSAPQEFQKNFCELASTS